MVGGVCCVCAERSRSLTLRSVMPEKTAETPAAVPSPAATPLDSPGSAGAGSSGGASDDATSDGTPQQKGGGKSSAGSSLVRAAAIWPWAHTLPALSLLCADRRLWRSLPALFAGPSLLCLSGVHSDAGTIAAAAGESGSAEHAAAHHCQAAHRPLIGE